MRNQSFLPSIQVFRGVAALMVVFHHLWHETKYFFHLSDNWLLDNLAQYGKLGVDFFFVLSGFIICYVHFDKGGQPRAARDYILNRLLRIFIPYLPIGLLMLAFYHTFPNVAYGVRDVSWVKSIFLVAVPGVTALAVAWTLVHELFFYTLFVSFFFRKQFFYGILTIWALAITAAWSFGFKPVGSFTQFVLSPYNLEFAIGALAATLVMKTSGKARSWLPAGFALATILLFLLPTFLEDKVLLGALFALLILLAIRSRLNRISSRHLLMILGNASYSIYLVHDPEISILMRVAPKWDNLAWIVVVGLGTYLVACFTGVLYSRVFEQRVLRKAKAFLAPRPLS